MFLPNSLLQDPCKPVEAGESVRSLAKGYVKNTSCIFDYQLLLEKQRSWTEQQKALYNAK
ncbi:hypothetical protein D9M71_318390 [compost metagenome]